MKILMAGRGHGGSWAIRGVQLGQAIGAVVDPQANSVKGYDLAVVVKRPRADLLERLHQRNVPIVWDVVDAWPQPYGNEWDRALCLKWLKFEVESIRPAAIVAATQCMANDCAGFGLPILVLPHHCRSELQTNPIRPRVHVVGYEGGEQYLGWWREWLEKECARRGWRFEVNPSRLAELDIVVAVRAQQGYAPKHWKSGVKLANAQGSGTPCIVNREMGCMENASGGEWWADTKEEMVMAMDALVNEDARLTARSRLLSKALKLDDVATGYKEWLTQIASSCSAIPQSV